MIFSRNKKHVCEAFMRCSRIFSLILLFAIARGGTVNTALAQETVRTISVKFENTSVLNALREINRLSGNQVVFRTEEVAKETKRVTFESQNTPVITVVEKCLEGTSLGFLKRDGRIVVVPQSRKVTKIEGFVHDEGQQPLPGVTVLIKGTSLGVSTDAQGHFQLSKPEGTANELIFSFIGMKTEIVEWHEGQEINVTMKEETKEMDEVVVTGYQVIDRRKNTSAIQTLNVDKIKTPGVTRIDQMLEGHVPGMTFIQNSGQAGATPKIRVRGTSTVLGSQEPVWVLDGIILRDPVNVSPTLANNLDFVNLVGNAIAGINPDDIERIDILKDASATALYGAKAANGVIVVTTKKGKAGPPSVTYSMNGTFTARPRYGERNIYLMNSKERIDYSREVVEKDLSYPNITNYVGYEGALNKYLKGEYSYTQFQNEVNRLETSNTDWFDLITENVFSHNHTLSLSGGSNNIRYYASIGYSNEKGVIKKEKNDRYSTMLKVNGNFDKFAFNFTIQGNKGIRNYTNQEVDILDYAYNTSRAIPAYNEDGSLYFYNKAAYNSQGEQLNLKFNALNEMQHARDEYTTAGMTLTADLNYRFTEDLKLQFMFSYGFSNSKQETFMDEESWYAASLRGTDYGIRISEEMKEWSLLPLGGEYRLSNTQNDNYTLRAQLDFNKFLGKGQKHLLNASLGFELSSNQYKGSEQTFRGYLPERGLIVSNFDPQVYLAYADWQMNGDEAARGIFSDNIQNELSAYLTLTYTLNNTYSFNFNTRTDASNKFGDRSNEKILPVWSVSASWDMKERLLQNASKVDFLTLKASFGYQGNILSDQSPELIIEKGDYDDDFGKFTSEIKHYPNPNLRWEKTKSVNATIDFAFFNNRLRGSVSYFYKKTKDAFLSKTVSDINGLDSYVINSGELENKGVELSLNFVPINMGAGGFRWDFDPQLGQVVNSLLTRAVNNNNFEQVQDEIYYSDYLNGNVLIEGEPLNTFYSYKFAGLSPEDGRPMFHDVEEELKDIYLNMEREDVFREVMEVSGTRVPTIQGGLTNTFSYKRMSLGIHLSYSLGSKIRMLKLFEPNRNGETLAPLPERNLRREFVNRWQNPGDERHTNIPGLLPNAAYVQTLVPWWAYGDYAANRFAQDIWQMYDNSNVRVASGNYLKIQSISFRYTFSDEWCKKLSIKSAYVGLSGANLATWCSKKLKGQDPTQSGSADQLNLSIRPSYSINLSVTF